MDAITCENCGACCMEQCSPPMLAGYLPGGAFDNHFEHPDHERASWLPQGVKDALMVYMRKLLADEKPLHPTYPACMCFDKATRRCTIYELRPTICRDFEVGSEACLWWRTRYGIERREEVAIDGARMGHRCGAGNRAGPRAGAPIASGRPGTGA